MGIVTFAHLLSVAFVKWVCLEAVPFHREAGGSWPPCLQSAKRYVPGMNGSAWGEDWVCERSGAFVKGKSGGRLLAKSFWVLGWYSGPKVIG